VRRRRDAAAHEGGADRVLEGRGRQVRVVPRDGGRWVPVGEGIAAAGRAAAGQDPLRDDAGRQGARDASSRATDAHRADARPSTTPHASDAGADGGDAGGRVGAGRAVRRVIATAIVGAVAVTGVLGQSSTPSLSHEFAEVNGQRLHYVTIGRGPLILFLHGFPEFWYEWKHQLAEFA